MAAKALMVLGTASHVGKSILTAGLCRIFKQQGLRVAPFKAQNMALNSAATPDGGEIGRAQALQAEACGIPPTTDMNPILIKPASDHAAQYVVQGKVWRNLTAQDYFDFRVRELFPRVLESYARLAAQVDLIVLEGAGSPAEINLRDRDIVNMRMAHAADAACLLVGDIDRGGVFASLVGTLVLLEDADRARIRGTVINKFRGDQALLEPGLAMLEAHTQRPCVGVVPYLANLDLDEEDSVALEGRRTTARTWRDLPETPDRPLRIGVIALPSMSNFTDFDALAAEPSVALAFIEHPAEVAAADVVILPGTKQTLRDLGYLRTRGFAETLLAHARIKPLIGICGGMQMLGQRIEDPHGAEGGGTDDGLGCLPIVTILQREKCTTPAIGQLRVPTLFGRPLTCRRVTGYEIHLGTTIYATDATALFDLERATGESVRDGAVSSNGNVIGTYLHGLFDDDDFRHGFIAAIRSLRNLLPATNVRQYRLARYQRLNRLADALRISLDMAQIERWLGL
ncbi:cobyric acid synthase [Chloracidobacterium validum]|uniref:Cobyric acid synthase n=1 Tax=Chloracidobacterium validum TaxID=2821543 RepID=A0ABX8B7Q7_9BACT|nr:cobyric acid synthase [Chloracidobacterium validum]QUW02091.1 cobyric acid synthase [Chloracidobacterium validum]